MTGPTRLTRRRFLTGAAGAGALGATGLVVANGSAAHLLGLGERQGGLPNPAGAGPSELGRAGQPTLVLVTLYGGNDGINTVIPYNDSAYQAGRSDLAYQAHEVLALDRTLGLHPNLSGFKSLWDTHQLAIVLGVGYPSPNRSHFRSMDIWQSAVPETDEVTGWLGRWLDQGGDDPLRALSFGPTLPKLLEGARTAGGSVPAGNMTLPGGNGLNRPFADLETVSSGEGPLAARVAQSGHDLLTVIHTVGDVLASQPATDIATPSLESGVLNTNPTTPAGPTVGAKPSAKPAAPGELATQLDVVARLIKGGAPTRVYSVSLGGFDTHAAEKATHARLLAQVDSAVSGFLKAFDGDARGDHVVVMAYSEFGRRVNANASGGTDHGTAAPLFIAGKPVKGGFYGQQPSLTDLDHGDLKFSTDFRSVYATLLEKVMSVDPKSVLNGKTYPTLPFL